MADIATDDADAPAVPPLPLVDRPAVPPVAADEPFCCCDDPPDEIAVAFVVNGYVPADACIAAAPPVTSSGTDSSLLEMYVYGGAPRLLSVSADDGDGGVKYATSEACGSRARWRLGKYGAKPLSRRMARWCWRNRLRTVDASASGGGGAAVVVAAVERDELLLLSM